MANEKEYTGLVSAITAPAYIDNDGIIYVVINLVDTVPSAPEVPYFSILIRASLMRSPPPPFDQQWRTLRIMRARTAISMIV